MKRKCTITIEGADDSQEATFAFDFDPPADAEPRNSGFQSAVIIVLNSIQEFVKQGAKISDVVTE